MNETFIKPSKDHNIYIASFGHGRNQRMTVIKSKNHDDHWEKVGDTRVLLVGQATKKILIDLLNTQSRRKINLATTTDQYPSGAFSSSTYKRLRDHLKINNT